MIITKEMITNSFIAMHGAVIETTSAFTASLNLIRRLSTLHFLPSLYNNDADLGILIWSLLRW